MSGSQLDPDPPAAHDPQEPMMTQRDADLRDEVLKRGANVMEKIVAGAAEKGAKEG